MTTRFDSAYHAPVLVEEILALFAGATRALDGTLGGGGHSAALLEAGMDVTGIDRDPAAIAEASSRLQSAITEGRFRTLNGNYADADALLPADAVFDAILLDLGVSSHQIDDDARGFSFREGAPLGGTMDSSVGRVMVDGRWQMVDRPTDRRSPTAAGASGWASAADFLNDADVAELTRAFKEYGDERQGGRLAREVVHRREHRPFAISDDLVGAIRAVLGPRSGPGDFARLFQAVRIAVNDELDGLARALPALRDRLAPRGVLAVIAYHSGEDRLVKLAFREWSSSCVCPPKQPMCTCRGRPLGTLLTRKPITAADAEVARNVRARSAHLRAFRREG
ncbi:MAG: 16S rRNA (cytosine(1402)-N(4))-methyltransferase [Gemmatimonadaceae bacterium]|nr:16S rRNA (cytosine(1402)-N(4))-methyltransferase [Gemmatimonadaceae bacterium]